MLGSEQYGICPDPAGALFVFGGENATRLFRHGFTGLLTTDLLL